MMTTEKAHCIIFILMILTNVIMLAGFSLYVNEIHTQEVNRINFEFSKLEFKISKLQSQVSAMEHRINH